MTRVNSLVSTKLIMTDRRSLTESVNGGLWREPANVEGERRTTATSAKWKPSNSASARPSC